jgi:hypothetical protein
MKRVVGALFLLAGAFGAYQFAASGMFHGRELLGGSLDRAVPFLALGKNYPVDALLAAAAAWALLIGCGLVITGGASRPAPGPAATGASRFASAAPPRKGGRVACLMLLNALLLVTSLFVAYIGAKSKQDAATVAVFATTALLQVAVGVILLVLALFERPKGVLSLLLGTAVFLFGAGVGVVAFLWGA